MKKCLRCTKQATLHITEVKSGKALSLHLCETCAQDYLSTVEVGGMPDNIAAGSPALMPPNEEDELDAASQTVCPHCGITYKQFRSQGRLGCPHDYEVFHDELLPLLESIHGETQHVGKCPPAVSSSSRVHYELIRLRNSLRDAVDNEQYEQAARLRDRIQELETEIGEAQD